MEPIENTLAKYPFFSGMEKRHLKQIARHARAVKFQPGKLIGEDNEPANYFYLLMDGRVMVELYSPEQGDLLIQTLETGDVVGWSWLVPPYQWRFNARAVAETQAIAFDGNRLRALCDKDPRLGYEILKRFLIVITGRLEAASIQLLDFYGSPKKRKKK